MYYHNILHDDMRNGEGLRVVLFVSGCNHRCEECQNPQTWDCESGIEFDSNAFSEIFEALGKDYISGLTLSGGDPFHPNNVDMVSTICSTAKSLHPNKTVWIYTGFLYEELLPMYEYSILKNCDVLIDGEYKKELADVKYPWAGSTNQRIIDCKKSLEQGEIVLWKH